MVTLDPVRPALDIVHNALRDRLRVDLVVAAGDLVPQFEDLACAQVVGRVHGLPLALIAWRRCGRFVDVRGFRPLGRSILGGASVRFRRSCGVVLIALLRVKRRPALRAVARRKPVPQSIVGSSVFPYGKALRRRSREHESTNQRDQHMPHDGPVLDQVNLVVSDMEASVAFYELLGLTFQPSPAEWADHHRSAITPAGLDFDLDSSEFTATRNRGWPGRSGRPGGVISFRLDSRDEVALASPRLRRPDPPRNRRPTTPSGAPATRS